MQLKDLGMAVFFAAATLSAASNTARYAGLCWGHMQKVATQISHAS
jgi:hypothetical protein